MILSTTSRLPNDRPADLSEGDVGWRPVVVGVDGSPESAQAATLGSAIAARADAACMLVHAVPDYWTAMIAPEVAVDARMLAQAAESHARAVVSQALQGAVPASLIASLEVRSGRGPIVLDMAATAAHAEVVVLGGKRRRALTRIGGSTVTHMVRLGQFPVLATDGVNNEIRRILVAVDLSYAAKPTLDMAVRWARMLDAELRVLHCVEPMPIVPGIRVRVADDEMFRSSERAVQAELPAMLAGAEAEIVVRRGRAAAIITSEVRQWRADLVILGSHGKGWVDRLLIGSTSERLLNVLPTSILVVPVSKPAQLAATGRIAFPWEAEAR